MTGLPRLLALSSIVVVACAKGGGAPAAPVAHAPSTTDGEVADVVEDGASSIRAIDDECRDASARATSSPVSGREVDGLELQTLGELDGRVRLAAGFVEVGESSIQVSLCYRGDGSLAKATKQIDVVEHAMGDRNRQLEASVVRYFDPQGALLQVTGTKKLSLVRTGAVLDEGPVTERDVAPDADDLLAAFDRDAPLVMQAAQLAP